MFDKAWYLVYSKPKQEDVAVRNLEQQDYSVYLPYLTEKKRVRGALRDVTGPMFPRYLFIELDQRFDNWSPIRSTRGVSGMVRFGMQPARVPSDFITCLQANAQRMTEVLAQAQKFSQGDKVVVLEGPFKGYEVVFQAQKGAERAVVLLEIANRYTPTQCRNGCAGAIIMFRFFYAIMWSYGGSVVIVAWPPYPGS